MSRDSFLKQLKTAVEEENGTYEAASSKGSNNLLIKITYRGKKFTYKLGRGYEFRGPESEVNICKSIFGVRTDWPEGLKNIGKNPQAKPRPSLKEQSDIVCAGHGLHLEQSNVAGPGASKPLAAYARRSLEGKIL